MTEKHKAPGKSNRVGLSIFELQEMFPDEESARKWWEAIIWPNGERFCPDCGSTKTRETPKERMPYRCGDCKQYFSVKKATVMRGSPIPLRKWVYAIYLDVTSLKGVASMKLRRDLKVTQKTAWYMQQRIREAFDQQGPRVWMEGPVEADESFFGGKRQNMPYHRRKQLTGRGKVGKTAVAAVKDRKSNLVVAKVVERIDRTTLHEFVGENVAPLAPVFTDDWPAYRGIPNHHSVKHSAGQYVNGQIHTNGVESFWSMLKRAYKGTFHKMSPKHLQRYVNEFAARHNIRALDTTTQMAFVARKLMGRRLRYEELIADNGLPSGAR